MLTINNIPYKTIKEAVAATGLKPAQLKRRYFTTGRGIVDGFDIVFDDAQAVDINRWITDNYVTLYETTTKYYEFDEDLFQDCIIHLINKVAEGKVKNYEQAFYNRYRGAVLDAKRKKATVTQIQAEQSYILTAYDDVTDYVAPIKTKLVSVSPIVGLDEDGFEIDVLDSVSHSLWDDESFEPEVNSVNELVQIDCVKSILLRTIPKNWIEFYFDAINKTQLKGPENSIFKLGEQYGFKKSEVTKIRRKIDEQLKDEETLNEIRECYAYQKYNTFDDLTLKDILS